MRDERVRARELAYSMIFTASSITLRAIILHPGMEQEIGAPDLQITFANSDRPSFFAPYSQFYSYVFDVWKGIIMHCVHDILEPLEKNRFRIEMYMNSTSLVDYQNCETSYFGTIEHFDAVTDILLTNQQSPMEKASSQIFAPYLDSETKWGLFKGFSSRPMMPVATKMLFSTKLLKEDASPG